MAENSLEEQIAAAKKTFAEWPQWMKDIAYVACATSEPTPKMYHPMYDWIDTLKPGDYIRHQTDTPRKIVHVHSLKNPIHKGTYREGRVTLVDLERVNATQHAAQYATKKRSDLVGLGWKLCTNQEIEEWKKEQNRWPIR